VDKRNAKETLGLSKASSMADEEFASAALEERGASFTGKGCGSLGGEGGGGGRHYSMLSLSHSLCMLV